MVFLKLLQRTETFVVAEAAGVPIRDRSFQCGVMETKYLVEIDVYAEHLPIGISRQPTSGPHIPPRP
jgi:hypothetical protein